MSQEKLRLIFGVTAVLRARQGLRSRVFETRGRNLAKCLNNFPCVALKGLHSLTRCERWCVVKGEWVQRWKQEARGSGPFLPQIIRTNWYKKARSSVAATKPSVLQHFFWGGGDKNDSSVTYKGSSSSAARPTNALQCRCFCAFEAKIFGVGSKANPIDCKSLLISKILFLKCCRRSSNSSKMRVSCPCVAENSDFLA